MLKFEHFWNFTPETKLIYIQALPEMYPRAPPPPFQIIKYATVDEYNKAVLSQENRAMPLKFRFIWSC